METTENQGGDTDSQAAVRLGPDVTLYCGDCLEVLPSLEAGSVDAVVTDPPWMDYETGRYDASGWHRPIAIVSPDAYLPQLVRTLRNPGYLVLWCRWDILGTYCQDVTGAGLTVKNCIVWGKPNHTAGDLNGNLGNKHEMAVFAVKGRWQRSDNRETNLWLEKHLFSRAKREHPTQKPVNLMERCIRLANGGATVLDPFMGSGTTGVACVKTGRKFIGIEIDQTYFDIAVQRIKQEQMQMRMEI